MPKRGKNFENLVKHLEEILNTSKDAKITAPKRYRDVVTGQLREHDVVIEVTNAHHKNVIAIECKELSRPVGVPMIEAFITKCRNSGINKGVIVSSSGFCKTAKVKATHYNIDCVDLNSAGSLDWSKLTNLKVITDKKVDTHWTFFPENKILTDKKFMEIQKPDGALFATEEMSRCGQNIYRELRSKNQIPDGPLLSFTINVPGQGFKMKNTETGEISQLVYIKLTFSVQHSETEIPFENWIYKRDDQVISEAVSAPFQINGQEFKLMITGKEDEEKQITLIKEATK